MEVLSSANGWFPALAEIGSLGQELPGRSARPPVPAQRAGSGEALTNFFSPKVEYGTSAVHLKDEFFSWCGCTTCMPQYSRRYYRVVKVQGGACSAQRAAPYLAPSKWRASRAKEVVTQVTPPIGTDHLLPQATGSRPSAINAPSVFWLSTPLRAEPNWVRLA